MNTLIKNPNGTINFNMSAECIIAKVGGFAESGKTNVVSELAVAREAVIVAKTAGLEEGTVEFENAVIGVKWAFGAIVRAGKKVGSIFHIGKQFYDFTVWTAYDYIESLASMSDFATRQNQDPAIIYRYQAEATELQKWAREYAREVGLNEDVK